MTTTTYEPLATAYGWMWTWRDGVARRPEELPVRTYNALSGGTVHGHGSFLTYPTREAAVEALAAVEASAN